jgi:Orsellinic acid/F9775 biosynthesis cluster protein D
VLNVLLCKHGHGAFIPEAAPGHAKKIHKVNLAGFDNLAFLKHCEDSHIRKGHGPNAPKFTILPTPKGPPVQLVELYEGFACSRCAYCCCSKSWMENHIRDTHPDMYGQASRCHYPTTVQTLFPNVGRVFFEVNPALVNLSFHDPMDHILRHHIPSLPQPFVTPTDTDRERTPFMRFMDWDKHLAFAQKDRSRLGLILSLVHQPAAPNESHLGDLARLSTAMEEYIRLGMRIAMRETQSFNVLKVLVHGRDVPTR